MPPTYVQQRITFFADDDVTPLLGAVDVDGTVIDPSFSTDPTHARPYLEFQPDTGSAEINFAEGSSSIGQQTVVIGDKRQDPADQSTGIFTWLQASGVTGTTQTLRRRVLWEGLRADGITWEKLLNAVLYRTVQNADLVSFTLSLRDMRERERRVRLFVRNNDAVKDDATGAITVTEGTCVFPRVGPLNGWGRPTTYDAGTGRVVFDLTRPPQLDAVRGVKGIWYQDLLGGSYVLFNQIDPENRALIIDDDLRKILDRYGQSAVDGTDSIPLASGIIFGGTDLTFDRYVFRNVIAQWSTTPTGPWNTLKLMPGNSGPYFMFGPVFQIETVQPLKQFIFPIINTPSDIYIPDESAAPVNFVRTAKLIPSAGDVSPVNGQTIYVRYISNLAPEEDVPRYIERESFGVLLKEIYDGKHSDPQVPPRVQYDPVAMDAFIVSTPPLVSIIEATDPDMRGWTQENIYKPNGAAPALSPDGLVTPVMYALPAAGAALLVLTDANVEKATWEHGDSNAVNKVSFTYQRDLVQAYKFLMMGPRFTTQDVTIEDWSASSLALFNAKTLEYKPVTAHSVLLSGGPFKQVPNVTNEVGWRLAIARSADVLTRFGAGAPECKVSAKATDTGVYQAKVGDWVVLQLSWLPEYSTRRRGSNRLMQISRVKKPSPILREFTLVDAGAYTAAMTCPTVSGIAQDAQGRVSVNVTAIPVDTIARLEMAVGDTQPSTTSGAWLLMVRTDTTGTFSTTPQAPGTKVWIRWRGEQIARQPSAWCGALSIVVADVAQMVDADLIILTGGTPRVSWVGLASTVGVRILYERHADGTAPPIVLTQQIDTSVNTNGGGGQGYIDLPFALDPMEQITAQVVGYPGFAGGAVTGTAGYASQYMTAQYLVAIGPPTVLPSVTVVGLSGAATLKVDSGNPSATFNVQVKDDAGVIWTLVTSGVDATPLSVTPGTVVPASAWYHNGAAFAQLLSAVVLVEGVVRTFYAKAITEGAPTVTSGWVAFSFQGEITTDLTAIEFLVAVASPLLSAERQVASTTTVAIDVTTPGVATFYVPDLGITPAKLAAGGTTPDDTKAYFGDGTWRVPAVSGTSGPILAQQTIIKTTSSLANNAGQTILLDIAASVAFQEVITSAGAWVRVYNTLAALNADIGRAYGTDVARGSSGEPIWETGTGIDVWPLTWPFRRNRVGHNRDSPRIGRFYMRVVNKSGATAMITTTIKYLPLEAAPAPVPPDTAVGMLWRFNAQLITPVADGTETLVVANAGTLGGDFSSTSGFGSGPKYKLSQFGTLPGIKFTQIGGNTRHYNNPTAGYVTPTQSHVFAVLKTIGGGSAWMVGPDRTAFPATAGNVSDWHQSSVERLVPITNDPTAPFLYHSHSAAAIWEAYVATVQRFADATNTVSGTAQNTLGGHLAGGFFANVFEGVLGEWRFYAGALTDDEILGIKLQMSTDWGLSL